MLKYNGSDKCESNSDLVAAKTTIKQIKRKLKQFIKYTGQNVSYGVQFARMNFPGVSRSSLAINLTEVKRMYTSAVLGAGTTAAAAVVLPNTGSNGLLTFVAAVTLAVGVAITATTAGRLIAKKAFKA